MFCVLVFLSIGFVAAFFTLRAVFAQPPVEVKRPVAEPVRAAPPPARVVARPRLTRAPSHSNGWKVLWVLGIGCAVAAAAGLFAPRHASVVAPKPDRPLSRMKPRELQQYTAESAVARAAEAGQRVLVKERHILDAMTVPVSAEIDGRTTVERKPGVAIQLIGVKSGSPHTDEKEALRDALEQAQEQLAIELQKLDQPISTVPSIAEIQRNYYKPDSRRPILPSPDNKQDWLDQGLGENRKWVAIDVEVSDSQLRTLRGQERLGEGGVLAGAAFAVIAALFGFFRLDAWTKGYLTTVLAVGAAATVGGAVAFLAWMR